MAGGRLVLPSCDPVITNAGLLNVGATLTVYNTGTDTLASIFADIGLMTPIENPQISNSAGRFYTQSTEICADSAQAYDVVLAPTDGSGPYTYQQVYVLGAAPSITGYAPLNSPAFTGVPTAPTPAANDSSSKIATTQFVTTAVSQFFTNNQYVLDTSVTANTITVAVPNVGGYSAGLSFYVKVANTNTGAVVINANSLGNKSVTYQGAAITAGELVAGVIYAVCYDGTNFQILSAVAPLASGVGYTTLPDGTIMQWGVSPSSSGPAATAAVVFPIPYTSLSTISITITARGNYGAGVAQSQSNVDSGYTVNGFTINNQSHGTGTFFWQSVGR